MMSAVIPIVIVVLIIVGVEALRWALRPEARRLRVIKKIGARR